MRHVSFQIAVSNNLNTVAILLSNEGYKLLYPIFHEYLLLPLTIIHMAFVPKWILNSLAWVGIAYEIKVN